MKKSTLIIALLFTIIINTTAQQLPNGSFENWSHQSFNIPINYLTSNTLGGVNNVTKVTDSYHNSFAAKLETVNSGTNVMQGMLLIGTPGNQTINGGIPYIGTPDSISGYIKYNIQTNDTAFFIVAFKKNSSIIAQAVKIFTGVHLNYLRFAIPTGLKSSNPPDSMVVLISSSNLDQPQIAGSTLTIDSLSFINTSQIFPNGDFENWTIVSSGDDPNGWGTYANQFPLYNLPVLVTKTTDANSGSYAVKLISDTGTVQPPFGTGIQGDTIIGSLQLNLINGFSSTKFPFSYKPDSLVGFTKGIVDTGANNFNLIMVQMSNNGNTIGQAFYILQSTNNIYERFATNFTYTSALIPDSMQLAIFAGNPGNPMPGNVFYVDDLLFVYNSSGMLTSNEKTTFKILPNPASGILNLYFSKPIYGDLELNIYNETGSLVKSNTMKQNQNQVNINDLSNGIYIVEIKSKQWISKQKLVIKN